MDKPKDGTQLPVLWNDEKLFTVQAIHNNQNNRIYAQRKEERIAYQRQKSAFVMAWADVNSTGEKTPLIFIEKGVKINQHVYLNLLKKQLIPWINRMFKETGITLQQDGATSYTANVVQGQYGRCKDNTAGFWGKDLRPPSSPDLKPIDFAIRSILEKNSCSSSYQKCSNAES